MKIMAFIPARGGSKGVAGKNKRILGDKPLIAWTIEDALDCKLFDRIVVSTEDKELIDIAEEWGAEVIPRPEELATDTADLQDAVTFTLDRLEESGYVPDYMVAMFPTSPFRRPGLVDEAIHLALSDPDICYVHALRPIPFDPANLVLPDGRPFMAEDHAETLRGNLFAASMNFGVQRMCREGGTGRFGLPLTPDESIDIDLPEDWDTAAKVSSRWL